MGINLSLKNVPVEVYSRLKATAKLHRRSLNSEIVACLEQAIDGDGRSGAWG